MNSLTVTIIFIIISTIVGAFVKGRMKDRCLLDFAGDFVHLELKNGKVIWGLLQLEATGIELKYKEPYLDKQDNHIENSSLLYKNEYSNIQSVVRFINELNDKTKKERATVFKNVCNRKGLGGIKRKIRNSFATVRDSVMEVANLLIGRAKQVMPGVSVLTGQDKYVSQMQSGVLSTFNTSFEPLLEKHIGRKVILELSKEGKIIEYQGVLKGYTSEFLELMEVSYLLAGEEKAQIVDIVVPRSLGIIRHLSD